jgi:uncharacterized protein (DUF1697 family)
MGRTATYIALLRGINVTGRNKVPMAELRSLCGELGWAGVRTYIQSGNVIFAAAGPRAEQETRLERAIETRFGLSIPVIVRAAKDWPDYVAGNPFPEASRTEANRVLLALSKATPAPDAEGRLRERAAHGERVTRVDDALWVHYPSGVGQSKLSPALFDRLVGSPVTARNWRTVLRIHEMARESRRTPSS